MKKLLLFISALGMALALSGKSYAFVQDYNSDKVSVSIISNLDAVNATQPLDILLKFTMREGAHIYSETPGDIGMPTKVIWKLPRGFKIGSEKWSRDKRFENEGIVQYGYDDTAYYRVALIPSALKGENADFQAEIKWLVCKGDECKPGKAVFNFSLPVSNDTLRTSPLFMKESVASEKYFNGTTQENHGLLMVLLMAFLGGIILNFMPCIFPILTIKAIALAQGTISKTKSRIEALIYMAGVVSSFLLIASVLVFLRARGEQIGWGFQLQSPIFVIIMIVIFFIIFLMLLDVVSIRNPFANKVGRISFARRKINAFVTGFFAVLIASPCTAPFMGIAIGYTLSQPIYIYYPVFLALSFGYALPFTLVGFYPKAVHKILPKPGKWMDILKKIFAIPVFLTCLWLVWVLCSQISTDKPTEMKSLSWQNFNADKIEYLVKDNKPVFIDFTAKWCITCLVNKKIALQSDSFVKLAHDKNLNLFVADWTNNDAVIAQALEAYGRSSIPLYVYYDGHGTNYKILPQLLTPQILEEELK